MIKDKITAILSNLILNIPFYLSRLVFLAVLFLSGVTGRIRLVSNRNLFIIEHTSPKNKQKKPCIININVQD